MLKHYEVHVNGTNGSLLVPTHAELHRLGTSDNLLHQIQEKIKWADTMSEVNKKHQKEFEDKVEEAKKSIKVSWINLKHQLYCSFSDIE